MPAHRSGARGYVEDDRDRRTRAVLFLRAQDAARNALYDVQGTAAESILRGYSLAFSQRLSGFRIDPHVFSDASVGFGYACGRYDIERIDAPMIPAHRRAKPTVRPPADPDLATRAVPS